MPLFQRRAPPQQVDYRPSTMTRLKAMFSPAGNGPTARAPGTRTHRANRRDIGGLFSRGHRNRQVNDQPRRRNLFSSKPAAAPVVSGPGNHHHHHSHHRGSTIATILALFTLKKRHDHHHPNRHHHHHGLRV
ncbi:hypothetical protein BGZ49_000336 [Haplosporangium sp. Z 27]|nr:hypothetical protein BGZ49_000336 [Haplosporangium sp. Z 27]